MAIYKVPYTKFEFSNKIIDTNFYNYLRTVSKKEILSQSKEFRKKELAEFQSDFKTERICLLLGRIFLLISILSMILTSYFDDINANIVGPGIFLLFPSLFLLSFTYSYALTLRELKIGIKNRKNSLIKAQELAKESIDFNEFLEKITLKNK
jgi:hypothetical protein